MSDDAKMRIKRVVTPTVVVSDFAARIEQRAENIVMLFDDGKGQRVTACFDGRGSTEGWGSNSVRETYFPYADCPVMAHGKASGPVSDIQAMRFLRDALVEMDLGDFEDEHKCAGCGSYFVPAGGMVHSHTKICPRCNGEVSDDE